MKEAPRYQFRYLPITVSHALIEPRPDNVELLYSDTAKGRRVYTVDLPASVYAAVVFNSEDEHDHELTRHNTNSLRLDYIHERTAGWNTGLPGAILP